MSTQDELVKVLGDAVDADELVEVSRMVAQGLPPVTSRTVLATMFGIHPGLVWSFENRPSHHYRTFVMPKGKDQPGRRIDAPRVALKIVQKWLSVQLSRVLVPAEHVFGFVSGRSHVDAAKVHANARWLFSVDIENFFPSTPEPFVASNLRRIGFGPKGASLIARIACLRGALAQGAPSSPVLSNLCFQPMDAWLSQIAAIYKVRLTRYADDIVFSAIDSDTCPPQLILDVKNLFEAGVWRLAPEKISIVSLPNRLKVHGLLVHGEKVRLTKGYRNKLRAFQHMLKKDSVKKEDLCRLRGHVNYGHMVDRRGG
jgi:hypothetical protein